MTITKKDNFTFNSFVKYLRDYSLKLNGNDLLDKILGPIWTTENYE